MYSNPTFVEETFYVAMCRCLYWERTRIYLQLSSLHNLELKPRVAYESLSNRHIGGFVVISTVISNGETHARHIVTPEYEISTVSSKL